MSVQPKYIMIKNSTSFGGASRLGAGAALLVALVFVMVCAVVPKAKATVIAGWQFNHLSGTGNYNGLTSYAPDSGAGSLTTTESGTGDFIYNSQGTSLGQYTTSSSPNYDLKVGVPGTTATITLEVSGVGLSGFEVNYCTRNVTTLLQTWSYSVNGTSWTTLGNGSGSGNGYVSASGTSFAVYTENFSGATALNGATSVYLRDSFATPSGSGNTVSFDNIYVTAVPEKINVALAGFGLIFVGASAGRFYLRRRRSATV
jgi:hypothetical protein